jgi:acyl-CoA thioesterase I
MSANAERHAFFLGDSFVAGVGDPEHRGWVGRLAERSHADGNGPTRSVRGGRRVPRSG